MRRRRRVVVGFDLVGFRARFFAAAVVAAVAACPPFAPPAAAAAAAAFFAAADGFADPPAPFSAFSAAFEASPLAAVAGAGRGARSCGCARSYSKKYFSYVLSSSVPMSVYVCPS